eukprot:TRINITY_DN5820_c0_g1_i20.p1 TRINITY_DN5820_c0_g1~~TRINITY_DN5820_c0_g1_i20.p1  ORF type:complete len:307 (-),score=40.19 TRINITY_DN5820_c0_g1_i20:86-964(-)
MSPELREEASTFVVREEVRKNPLFLNLPPGVTRHMLPILDDVAVQQGECIVLQGEIGEFMYIFVTGMGKQRGASNGKTILRRGNSFGEEILLGFAERYSYSVSVMVNSALCRICEDEFKKTFETMPDVVTQMRLNYITKIPRQLSPARDERVNMLDANAGFSSCPPGFADAALSLLTSIKDTLDNSTGSGGGEKPVTDVDAAKDSPRTFTLKKCASFGSEKASSQAESDNHRTFTNKKRVSFKAQESTTSQVTQNHTNTMISPEAKVLAEVDDSYQEASCVIEATGKAAMSL